MIVCVCKAISDRDIKYAIQHRNFDLSDFIHDTGMTTGCGICAHDIKKLYKKLTDNDDQKE
jgi:bacterioferritin-associated ferredoxin